MPDKENRLRPSATELARRIGYEFQEIALLERALTHRSFALENNERLEFLGDSVLNLAIAEALYAKFPRAKEGQLSRLRAKLVCGETLAELAQELGFGPFLRLGSGELKSGGARRASILADSVEAVLGAIYLDGGYGQVRPLIMAWYQQRLQEISLQDGKDAKTRLQEYLQGKQFALPTYAIVSVQGKEHDQHFKVSCEIPELQHTSYGEGSSRRKAEQDAAEQALQVLSP